uniref:FH2 domain-containing protein n=1 Tax=Globodera rostochiensis TaxID=31243 RepID=A0A914HAB9_GLORO
MDGLDGWISTGGDVLCLSAAAAASFLNFLTFKLSQSAHFVDLSKDANRRNSQSVNRRHSLIITKVTGRRRRRSERRRSRIANSEKDARGGGGRWPRRGSVPAFILRSSNANANASSSSFRLLFTSDKRDFAFASSCPDDGTSPDNNASFFLILLLVSSLFLSFLNSEFVRLIRTNRQRDEIVSQQPQTLKTNSSTMAMDELTALSLSLNGGQQPQTPATIEKLLQISRQFLSGRNEISGDGMGKKNAQKRAMAVGIGNGETSPRGEESNGTERDGTAKGGGGGARGGNGDGRKRSYPYTFQFCVLCQKNVHSSKLPCHIRQCHVGKPMFQCPVCDFTSTYSKNNVKSHMVSLHGLAGDPISYMDQYASQVEEFMKQCFPNVRGRGRPLHGRLSPARVKQTVAANDSRSLVVTISPPTMSQSQQRRLSPATANAGPSSSQQRSGGRQQRTTTTNTQQQQQMADDQPMMVVGRAEAHHHPLLNGNNVDGGALLPFDATDVYGAAMGMLKTTTGNRTPTSLVPNKDCCSDPSLSNFGKGAAFGPLPQRDCGFLSAFNPFIYLQQLNNLFALNAVNPNGHQQQMPAEVKMETELDMPVDEDALHQQQHRLNASSMFSLEECLNLSQKFLKEMSKCEEPANIANCEANDVKSDASKELLICHSSSSNTSPHPSGCFPTNSSASVGAVLREEVPLYFPHQLNLTVLDGPVLEKTVFKTFANSGELIEKFDLSVFEPFLDQNSGSLLSPTQHQNVTSVRKQLGLKSFEIMFAVHRLDIDVLKPENVHLVMQIAPTDLDIRRFRLFEQSNSLNSLDEDEQFVVQLSKIDRLREKISVMALMGEFDQRVAQLNKHLLAHSVAAKLLFNSAEFHTILHVLLTCVNLVNGDFASQLVKGFRLLRLPEMCSFRFPDGSTLLKVLAQILRRHFPDDLDTFLKRTKVVEEAAKVEFAHFLRELRCLERGQSLVEEELQLCHGKNPQLANFLTHCELECAQLRECIQNTNCQVLSTMEFFGECTDEALGRAVIAQFARDLRSST